jgi:DNA-binding MarR family transcriptional regulator
LSEGAAVSKPHTVAGLVERLSHSVHGEAYRDGLKPAQWSALRYFAKANRFSRTTSAFANYHGTTAAAASQTITSLVEKALLRRTRDTVDKRKHHLNLTAKAFGLLGSDPIAGLTRAATALDHGELKALARCLEKMLAGLLTEQTGKKFGKCQD